MNILHSKLLSYTKPLTLFGSVVVSSAFILAISTSTVFAAGSAGVGQSPKIQTSALGSPLDLPVRSKSCTIEDEVRVASRVFSKNFSEVRAQYMSVIESFSVSKGQKVKKGQLLATTDSSQLTKMRNIYQDYAELYRSQLKISKNDQNLAEKRRDRLRGLVAKGIISESELEQADKQVLMAANICDRMNRGLEGMQKNVDLYSEQIRNSNFYSDMDGFVTELIVDPRSLAGTLNVMPGTLIAKIEQPGAYRAEAMLMDAQIQNLKQGMNANVTLPDGTAIDGKITYVSVLPVVEARQETGFGGGYGGDQQQSSNNMKSYKAIIDFVRAGPILPAGLLANVKIVTGEKKAKSCLPWNAIEIADGKAFVKSFKDGQGWSRMPVSIGKTGRYDVEIDPPISESLIIMSKLW